MRRGFSAEYYIFVFAAEDQASQFIFLVGVRKTARRLGLGQGWLQRLWCFCQEWRVANSDSSRSIVRRTAGRCHSDVSHLPTEARLYTVPR